MPGVASTSDAGVAERGTSGFASGSALGIPAAGISGGRTETGAMITVGKDVSCVGSGKVAAAGISGGTSDAVSIGVLSSGAISSSCSCDEESVSSVISAVSSEGCAAGAETDCGLKRSGSIPGVASADVEPTKAGRSARVSSSGSFSFISGSLARYFYDAPYIE